MAIQIEASYSKKLGLPNFSSHSFMITVRAEVMNLRRLERETGRLYRLLQESVDKQVQEVGFLPDATKYGLIASQPSNGDHAPNGATTVPVNGAASKPLPSAVNGLRCSDKQSAFIAKMAKRLHLSAKDLDAMTAQLFQVPVAEIDRKEASRLIDELFNLDGRPPRSRRSSSPATTQSDSVRA